METTNIINPIDIYIIYTYILKINKNILKIKKHFI